MIPEFFSEHHTIITQDPFTPKLKLQLFHEEINFLFEIQEIPLILQLEHCLRPLKWFLRRLKKKKTKWT